MFEYSVLGAAMLCAWPKSHETTNEERKINNRRKKYKHSFLKAKANSCDISDSGRKSQEYS